VDIWRLLQRIVRHHEYGGPQVLRIEQAPVPEPGPGEVLVRVEAAGVALPGLRQLCAGPEGDGVTLPNSPGGEIAGQVAARGPGTASFRVGQRVAGVTFHGAYSEYAAVPCALLGAVPDGVGAAEAMTLMRAGLVALGVLRTAHLAKGDSVLVTAAAGGVGHLAVQLAKALGAGRVVGAVGSPHKAYFVRSLGADEVVQYTDSDWGAPITVAVDGVGGRVLQRGLAALAPFGRLVSYSAASGPIETHELLAGMKTAIGFAMGRLASAQPQLVEQLRHDLWDLLAHGRLHPEIHAELPLEEAPKAYEILKARANLGKIVLRPTKRTT
jgi:NADPH:quinone reductase-like Zn-dependent oxidoreductase